MKSVIIFVLAISLAGNILGLYFLYKAYKLRDEVQRFQRFHKDLMAKYEALKSDYSGVSVYSAENQQLIRTTTEGERREMTIFFGASITKLWDLEKYFPGRKLINRGVGSQSDQQLLIRFPSDVLQLHPGRVVIKFCSGNFHPDVNDERMWDEYEMMVRMAQNRGILPIPATIIPVTRQAEEYGDYKITDHINEFNRRVVALAGELTLPLADYYKGMADRDGYLPGELARDQIHPNDSGYAVMTGILGPILDRSFGSADK